MKNIFLPALLILSAMATSSLGVANEQKEEKAASLVIGKILNSIDYKNSDFTFHYFEGSFVKKGKDGKSNLVIDALDLESSIRFKNDIIIEADDMSQKKQSSEQAKQWQPRISLLSKDLEIKSAINASNNNEINLLINFNRKSDSVNSNGLTVVIGNQFNSELMRMNFISFNIKLMSDSNSSQKKVLGSCLARKKVAKTIQPISTCTFSGVIDTEKETHNIQVKFGDKQNTNSKLN